MYLDEPISNEDFAAGYAVPLEEVTTDMIIVHECLKELNRIVRDMRRDEKFDYDLLRSGIYTAANVFMAFPRPGGGHNYMTFMPAVSVYIFGEDDEYTDPEPVI